MTDQLTDRETLILDVVETWRGRYPTLDEAIRDQLDLSSTRYFQILADLIVTERAEAARPLLVHRLQRMMWRGAAHRRPPALRKLA